MTISSLKKVLQQLKQASFTELTQRFSEAEPLETVQEELTIFLTLLMKKGVIRQQSLKPACGTRCQNCLPSTTQLYVWTGETA